MRLQSVASGLHGFPGWGTTAASLGRETISYYTQGEGDFKMNALQGSRLAFKVLSCAPFVDPNHFVHHFSGGEFFLNAGASGLADLSGAEWVAQKRGCGVSQSGLVACVDQNAAGVVF